MRSSRGINLDYFKDKLGKYEVFKSWPLHHVRLKCTVVYVFNSVSIATGYRLDDRMIGVRLPVQARNFSLWHHVQTGSGATQPPIQWVPGVLSVGVKRPGCKADHTPPSSAEVKEWVELYSTPQYVFMAWCLVKHKGQLQLYLYLYHDMKR
jgi:hypothetical protein